MRDIERYADDYNKPNFEDYQIVYRRKKILEILRHYSPQSIIEIGCGMEPLFQYIDFEYQKYVIVEPSKLFYDNAVSLADGDERIECYHGFFPLSGVLEDTAVFDFVICSSLLHELDEPISFLEGVRGVCKSSSIVHINVPNANSFHRILAMKMKLIENVHEFSERNKLYQQHNVYNLEELARSVEICGFEVQDKGSYFLKPFTHNQMYEMMDKEIISQQVLDGLYEMTDLLPDLGSEIFVNCKLKVVSE